MNKELRGTLEHGASHGATLTHLEVEIEKRRQLLSDAERDAVWLYAWALVKRHRGSPNQDSREATP